MYTLTFSGPKQPSIRQLNSIGQSSRYVSHSSLTWKILWVYSVPHKLPSNFQLVWPAEITESHYLSAPTPKKDQRRLLWNDWDSCACPDPRSPGHQHSMLFWESNCLARDPQLVADYRKSPVQMFHVGNYAEASSQWPDRMGRLLSKSNLHLVDWSGPDNLIVPDRGWPTDDSHFLGWHGHPQVFFRWKCGEWMI